MTDTIKHFEQQTSSTLCILFIQKSSSIFHTEQSCDWLEFDTSAARGGGGGFGGEAFKKTHLVQVFKSVTSFET